MEPNHLYFQEIFQLVSHVRYNQLKLFLNFNVPIEYHYVYIIWLISYESYDIGPYRFIYGCTKLTYLVNLDRNRNLLKQVLYFLEILCSKFNLCYRSRTFVTFWFSFRFEYIWWAWLATWLTSWWWRHTCQSYWAVLMLVKDVGEKHVCWWKTF